MNHKIVTVIKVIAIIVIMILVFYFKFWPEYKNTIGSSDSLININKYEDIIEFNINSTINFALVTSKDKVTNILFFDEASLCLYNKNIENNNIDDAITNIVKILIENNHLKQNDTITITNYKNKDYEKVKNKLTDELQKLEITITFIENSTTIIQRSRELGITEDNETIALGLINVYSQDIIRNSKITTSTNKKLEDTLTEELAKEYANNVYKKIERYSRTNNIVNQDISSAILPINLIPADEKGIYYPCEDSWYYIKSNKVYAYISFSCSNTKYSYCYQGSIDEYKKGEC